MRFATEVAAWRNQHVCFTDCEMASLGWEVRVVKRRFKDQRREARMYKALPHLFLPGATTSIWHDGTIGLKVLPEDVVGFLGDHDVAAFQHPWHNTLTEEAAAIVREGKAKRSAVREQLSAYTDKGYPVSRAPFATGVLIRKHTGAITALNNAWWAEMTRFTLRDQLSFDYLCWVLGIECGVIPAELWPGLSPDAFWRCEHREPKFHTN